MRLVGIVLLRSQKLIELRVNEFWLDLLTLLHTSTFRFSKVTKTNSEIITHIVGLIAVTFICALSGPTVIVKHRAGCINA